MARKPTPKLQKLLNEIKRRGSMTRKEMVEFLIPGNDYTPNRDRGTYNAQLYGTRDREGIIERFLRQRKDGSYSVRRKIQGPFTPVRETPRSSESTGPSLVEL